MTVFVDTSAWYAVLDDRDESHHVAVRNLEALAWRRERLVTHNYVVVETLALIARRLGKLHARTFVTDLVPIADIDWVLPATHDLAMAAYVDSSRRLSLVDHVSFALMRSRGIQTAFAFDDDFEEHGFTLLRPA